MKLHVNKDLIFFFKYFISSYNMAILVRKNGFKMPYIKDISNIILPYFVKSNLIRHYKVFSENNVKFCIIYLKYNHEGNVVSSKLKLCFFKKDLFKINRFTLNRIFKYTKHVFNYDYYFIYKGCIYNLNDLRKVNLENKVNIYLIFKNF